MKRIEKLPTKCSRCGNDLMTGQYIMHLPYEDRYVCLCKVCFHGVAVEIAKLANLAEGGILESQLPGATTSDDNWEKFWEGEVSNEKN